MDKLDRYYEKFDEDNRLKRRHGQVEYFVTNFYIQQILKNYNFPKIADIGAGTGAYSVPLSKQGFDVTAVEYSKNNLKKLRAKHSNVKTFWGDAKNLDMFQDEVFDVTLLFGPMYHSLNFDDKIKCLNEAKRITKSGGTILVAYYMNEYGILSYGFVDGNIKLAKTEDRIDDNFHIVAMEDDLFSFDRIEDIDAYNTKTNLQRQFIFAPDGASDYMRNVLNNMDNETFELYKKYQLSVSKRSDLFGASSHLVDVLKKWDVFVNI